MAGKIEFGGEEQFRASPERVYGLLTDLDAMATIIPDLESAEKADAQSLKCVVRPGFSFLRGKMKLTISLSDTQPPERAVMRVAAKGIGVSMDVNSQLNIAPDGDGSRLIWTANVEKLTGLISVVSPALIKAAADQVIRHAWTQVRGKLGEGE